MLLWVKNLHFDPLLGEIHYPKVKTLIMLLDVEEFVGIRKQQYILDAFTKIAKSDNELRHVWDLCSYGIERSLW